MTGSRQSSDIVSQILQLAVSYCESGQLQEAEATCQQALAINPKNAHALHTLGIIALHAGRYDDAVNSLKRAVKIEKNTPVFYHHLGLALQNVGKLDEAVTNYERAISLQPNLVETYIALGALYDLLGNREEALKLFIKAVVLKPDHAIARFNLAHSLQQGGHIHEAIEQYVEALTFDPAFFAAHVNIGGIYKKMAMYDAAIMHYEQADSLQPANSTIAGDLVHVLQHVCAWDSLGDREASLLEMVRQKREGISPFGILGVPSSPADQLLVAHTQSREKEQNPATLFNHTPGKPRERIRIGYLSADFHNHATAYLMAELFERHDRKHFEVIGYSYGPDDDSPIRKRVVKAFDRFIDLRTFSDGAAAKKIHDDGIDILIDLKGHTEDSRLGIPACRPAPVQVNYVGYPGTMGAGFIDYIIADRFIIPENLEKFYSEKIICLPDSYQPNDTAREIADETPSRTECGLPEQGFVFCSFNNSYKITPAIFDIWMRLLLAVPGSVLWLLEGNDFVKDNLRREADRRGVDPSRLVFAPRMPLPQHLARHRLADLFLDTLPVNAHTTTSDALWAGLPVLTCAGETFASRVAGSLLTAAGLPELITHSMEDYEALALQLAKDPAKLTAIREKMARTRLETPLFNIERFTRNLEKAYTSMWQTWQSGEKPASFVVTKD